LKGFAALQMLAIPTGIAALPAGVAALCASQLTPIDPFLPYNDLLNSPQIISAID
jgi:hypothetical protein